MLLPVLEAFGCQKDYLLFPGFRRDRFLYYINALHGRCPKTFYQFDQSVDQPSVLVDGRGPDTGLSLEGNRQTPPGTEQTVPDIDRSFIKFLYGFRHIDLSKAAGETFWYRMFFDDNKQLRLNPAKISFSEKLDRNLYRHFVKPGLLVRSIDEHALFVNVTGKNDLNTYFLKIGIDSEKFTGMMKSEAKWIILIFLIALVLSRFLGYYFARKIARPIENLSEISTNVAKGDLKHLAPVTSGDEIGELASNFNKMVQGLKSGNGSK